MLQNIKIRSIDMEDWIETYKRATRPQAPPGVNRPCFLGSFWHEQHLENPKATGCAAGCHRGRAALPFDLPRPPLQERAGPGYWQVILSARKALSEMHPMQHCFILNIVKSLLAKQSRHLWKSHSNLCVTFYWKTLVHFFLKRSLLSLRVGFWIVFGDNSCRCKNMLYLQCREHQCNTVCNDYITHYTLTEKFSSFSPFPCCTIRLLLSPRVLAFISEASISISIAKTYRLDTRVRCSIGL